MGRKKAFRMPEPNMKLYFIALALFVVAALPFSPALAAAEGAAAAALAQNRAMAAIQASKRCVIRFFIFDSPSSLRFCVDRRFRETEPPETGQRDPSLFRFLRTFYPNFPEIARGEAAGREKPCCGPALKMVYYAK